MSKGPWAIKPTSLEKIVRAVEKTGLRVTQVRIDAGGITVNTAPLSSEEPPQNKNEWDAV